MNYTELVEKAKQKDEKAIEELFELTSKKGYFVALKYLKNKEDAQDILQDAYVSSLTKLDQLKDPSKYDKWLFQMIANKAKNYLVKNKPLLFEQLDSDDEDAIQFEETITDDRIEFQPKENTDYNELKTALKNLIDELPEDQRMCLLMYYFEELSINEIAESLELNNNTIKSRLNYARKRIKEKVEELQKQGTHLFGVAPIPFLVWMLLQEEQAVAVPQISAHLVVSEAIQAMGNEITKQGVTIFGKTISSKVIASVTTATIVLGASVGIYLNSQDKPKQNIYDSLTIEFSDKLVYEYGQEFDESELILNHTGNLKVLDEIDIKKVGKQTLKYSVSKDGVDRIFEIIVEIKDTKNPILTLSNKEIELTVNDKFEPLQYIKEAYDEIDGDLKDNVVIDNPVDVKKSGEYEVKYSVSDNNNLKTEAILSVLVKEKNEQQPVSTVKPDNQKPTNEEQKDMKMKTVSLGYMGLQMSIPASSTTRFAYEGGQTHYDINDSIYGPNGASIHIEYFAFDDIFELLEGNEKLRFNNVETYKKNGYEVYDRGEYLLAMRRGPSFYGHDDSDMNDMMTIHIEGKKGMYEICVLSYSGNIGVDEYADKRIELARNIFNSIK